MSFIITTTNNAKIRCRGNIEMLLDYQTAQSSHPAMAADCYASLFDSCTVLEEAPSLPATTLAYRCYYEMFENCTSLTAVPNLPANTLADMCYTCMFDNCTSLYVSNTSTGSATYAWRMPTSNPFTNTFQQNNMFYHCAGTRSSDHMAGESGKRYTYYTQNMPV